MTPRRALPHIKKIGGHYYCHIRGIRFCCGAGSTPSEAYEDWARRHAYKTMRINNPHEVGA